MPWWLSLLGDVLIIVAMWMVFRVFEEKSFGSATVEVAKNQGVISTGPAQVYFLTLSAASSGPIIMIRGASAHDYTCLSESRHKRPQIDLAVDFVE